jgi:hypothetical protein
MAGVPKLLVTLLFVIVAFVSALNVGAGVRAPTSEVKISVSPALANMNLIHVRVSESQTKRYGWMSPCASKSIADVARVP